MKINKLLQTVFTMMLVIILSSSFTGCSKNRQVILVPPQLENGEYWDDINEKLKNSAEESGYSYSLMGSEKWDAQEQRGVLQEAVKTKPSAIVLGPIVNEKLYPGLKEAQDNGVPLILIDSDIDRELLASDDIKVTTFVGIDNYKCGKDVADKLAEKLSPNSKVAILRGEVNSENSEKRCNGFKDEISQKGMNLVADISTDWSENDGYEKAKLILQSNPDLKAVFSVNCNVLKGIKKAADEADVDLLYGTFDTNDEIIDDIKEGSVVCTLDQDSDNMTKTIMEVVKKIEKGEKIDEVTTSEGKLITKNNA